MSSIFNVRHCNQIFHHTVYRTTAERLQVPRERTPLNQKQFKLGRDSWTNNYSFPTLTTLYYFFKMLIQKHWVLQELQT